MKKPVKRKHVKKSGVTITTTGGSPEYLWSVPSSSVDPPYVSHLLDRLNETNERLRQIESDIGRIQNYVGHLAKRKT